MKYVHNETAKCVVITGASRGIGLETVRYFAQRGHRTLALSRNVRPLQDLATEYGDLIAYESVDLGDDRCDLNKMVSGHFERVDALINNAGQLLNKPFMDTTIDEWHALFGVNLFSAIKMAKACIPFMPRSSHILNIGSMGGFQGSQKFPGLSAYSTTKGALSILTECLSEELGARGIHVNALCLGAVQTEMLSEAFPGYQAPVQPEQMASYIGEFILSHGALFNGKILPVAINNPN